MRTPTCSRRRSFGSKPLATPRARRRPSTTRFSSSRGGSGGALLSTTGRGGRRRGEAYDRRPGRRDAGRRRSAEPPQPGRGQRDDLRRHRVGCAPAGRRDVRPTTGGCMTTLVLVLRILAFLCFALAAVGLASKVNLTATGLALLTLSLVF